MVFINPKKSLWVHFFSEDIGKFIEDGGFQAWSMSQLSWVFFSVPHFETSRGLITPKMRRMMMLPRTPLRENLHGENPFMKTQIGCKNCKILRSNHYQTITKPLFASMWYYIKWCSENAHATSATPTRKSRDMFSIHNVTTIFFDLLHGLWAISLQVGPRCWHGA